MDRWLGGPGTSAGNRDVTGIADRPAVFRFRKLKQLIRMPGRDSALSSILHSPVRILAIILILVFTTEVVVMLVLPHVLPDVLGDIGEAFLDGLLLTLVCAPVLWLVILAAKRAEQERLTLARETEALRAQQMTTLAQLATGVAHEIRNPLTSIKMLIQVNRAKLADEGMLADDLELVEHEIRRMERSVNSLLEYARPERSEFVEFAIQQVVRNTVQLIDGRCDSQNVELIVQVPPAPATVIGDAAQIQQLLLNLALNALDAMPAGGQLSLAVAQSGKAFEIRVSDTGSGIDPAVEKKLFAPFVTTKENGVGLGLGICRRIAQSHDGTLTGANRSTRGAEFRLVLPAGRSRLETGAPADAPASASQPEAGSTCKVC